MIARTFFSLLALLFSLESFAATVGREDIGFSTKAPNGSILNADEVTLTDVLTLVQAILLKLVLPVIVVGAGLYIAYQLLTAEWDETKMKSAWKSITFSAIALIVVALSYAVVRVISGLAL